MSNDLPHVPVNVQSEQSIDTKPAFDVIVHQDIDFSAGAIEHKSAAEAYICQLSSLQSQQTARRSLARIARVFCGIDATNPDIGPLLSDKRQQAIERDEYLIENYPWGRMSKDLIVATLNKIVKDRKEALSPNTHRLYLSLLKGVARIALEKKQMSIESFQLIQTIRAGRGSRLPKGRPLDIDEQDKALVACEQDDSVIGIRDRAILEVFLATGMRRIELVSIQMSDLDLQEREILIHGKGNKERRVWLTESALDALNLWLEIRGDKDGAVFCPVRKGNNIHVDDIGLNAQSVNYILNKRGFEAGVDALKPHNLRRTTATEMDKEDINIRVIQQALGHNDVATTESYIFSGDQKVKNAMLNRISRKRKLSNLEHSTDDGDQE